MQMPADLRQVAHPCQEAIIEVPRVRAGKADALDAGDVVDGLEEAGEVARRLVRRLVVVDDLAEQLYFLVAAGRRVADFREDVGLWTHALVAARVRHHAEAAEFVAALDD